MIDILKEIDNDWIDFKKFEPSVTDYYDVSACHDPDNVIKWQVAAYNTDTGKFYSLSTLTSVGNVIDNVKLWRKSKN